MRQKDRDLLDDLKKDNKEIKHELAIIRKELFKLNNKPKYKIGDTIIKVHAGVEIIDSEIVDVWVSYGYTIKRTKFIHNTQIEGHWYTYKLLAKDKYKFIETSENNIIDVQSK